VKKKDINNLEKLISKRIIIPDLTLISNRFLTYDNIDFLFNLALKANCIKSLHASIIVHRRYGIIGSGSNISLTNTETKKIKAPTEYACHAEMMAVNDMTKRHSLKLLKDCNLFVLRVATKKKIACSICLSEPCYNCSKRLKSLKTKYGLRKVFWTTGKSDIPWNYF
jgi:hypothetical protein